MTEEEPKVEEEGAASTSFWDIVMYKIDRSLAILGVICISLMVVYMRQEPDSLNVATAAIGGLVGYVGGRSGK
jgi:hypothetical protein